jgi:uncharacterized RDD family membrane protein YckC
MHEYAGFWRRAGALLIDALVLVLPYLVLLAVLGDPRASLVSVGVDAAYFAHFSGQGQSVGAHALGIRVVDAESGAPIGFGRGLLRYVVSLPSFWILLLGYLWMLWDHDRQTWHDKAARNVVVRVRAT